jgi:hypothetical protein
VAVARGIVQLFHIIIRILPPVPRPEPDLGLIKRHHAEVSLRTGDMLERIVLDQPQSQRSFEKASGLFRKSPDFSESQRTFQKASGLFRKPADFSESQLNFSESQQTFQKVTGLFKKSAELFKKSADFSKSQLTFQKVS